MLGLIFLAIAIIPLSLFTEGGINLIPFILITYFFKENTPKRTIGYSLLSVLLFLTSYAQYDTLKMTIEMLMYNSDFLLITVIPFIMLYNGERGPNNKFNKYLFYVFYPIHLWTLAIIQFILK
ncbi:TraX family protein [Anaerocolumna sp.]|uniref:TraX family protein n=1 Tax=Anaerocolumna sp. TaxID=2041569 RepID=UPI0028AC3AF3|nr:TraX family protein [Anaerocolumna sp.]